MSLPTTMMPLGVCLKCGQKLDAATPTRGMERPEPGDITICLQCGHRMAFTRGMRLRELTKAERRESANDAWTNFAEQQRRTVMRKHKH